MSQTSKGEGMTHVFWTTLLVASLGLCSCVQPTLAPTTFRTAAAKPPQTIPTAYQVTGSGTFVPRSAKEPGFTVTSDLTMTVEPKNDLQATAGTITITDLVTGQTFALTPENIVNIDLQPRYHAADGANAQGPVAATKGRFDLFVDAQVVYQGQITKLSLTLGQSPLLPSGTTTHATLDVGTIHDTGRLTSGGFTLTPIP
jgi:hypothetical protein